MGNLINSQAFPRLPDLYVTRGMVCIRPNELDQIADYMSPEADMNERFLSDLAGLLHLRYDENRRYNGRRDTKDAIYNYLLRMQSQPLCRGTWCPLYQLHWSSENPCFTIGGLCNFLSEKNLRRPVQIIKEYFKQSGFLSRYPNSSMVLQSFCGGVADFFYSRRLQRGLQVMLDFNTMTEEEIKCLLRLSQHVRPVQAFVIPQWSSGFGPKRVEKWKDFVVKQISCLKSKSSVVVLKVTPHVEGIIEEVSEAEKERGRTYLRDTMMKEVVDSGDKAIRFIWLCIRVYDRIAIAVDGNDDDHLDGNHNAIENYVDAAQEDEEQIAMVQGFNFGRHAPNNHFALGRFNLESNKEMFVQYLQQCPYLNSALTKDNNKKGIEV